MAKKLKISKIQNTSSLCIVKCQFSAKFGINWIKWVRVLLFRRPFLGHFWQKTGFLGINGAKNGQKLKNIKISKHKFSLYSNELAFGQFSKEMGKM